MFGIQSSDGGRAGRVFEDALEAHGPSARALEVCLRFGVPMSGPSLPGGSLDRLGLCLAPGRVMLVSGPSGSGKSRLLAEIASQHPAARLVQDTLFPGDVPVVDAVLPTGPMDEVMGLLTGCGLGEPAVWLRRFGQLSEGERFRATLARAIGMHRRSGAPLLCDEFGSVLHARLARALAFNLRKLATRERLSLVVATSREDLEADLAPDGVVRLPWSERAAAGRCDSLPLECSSAARSRVVSGLRVERGVLTDYAPFSPMHYLQREHIGFVDRVFVLREGGGGPAVGVIVYGRPALELALRNRVTGGRWIKDAERLNRELRVIKRLVIHPDLRGCGLGHRLVRETLPLAGTPFVECLAAMAAVNPVFEKAGMLCVGTCHGPAGRDAALRELRAMGVEPFAADFASQVCRRSAVRRVVLAAVMEWYRATTGLAQVRTRAHTPTSLARTFRQIAGSRPVYHIWARMARGGS